MPQLKHLLVALVMVLSLWLHGCGDDETTKPKCSTLSNPTPVDQTTCQQYCSNSRGLQVGNWNAANTQCDCKASSSASSTDTVCQG
mmetsp:Transcript_88180/g.139386  ORF Transcript_88180/g.139386 Transcript_88180/m.139386 type:complete len:86 (-) Transcript_88180:109-366(-)